MNAFHGERGKQRSLKLNSNEHGRLANSFVYPLYAQKSLIKPGVWLLRDFQMEVVSPG